MSLIIEDIFGGIFHKMQNTAALNSLLSSNTAMYLSQAGTGAKMPFIVVTFISWTPMHILGSAEWGPREEARVQFGVFTEEREHSTLSAIVQQVDRAYGALGSGLTFTSSTYSATTTTRESMIGPEFDGKVWSMFLEYMMRFNTLT